MTRLIDSHCHLTYPELGGQIADVLVRAAEAGVQELVTIATDLADAERAFRLARQHPEIHVACGIHPHQAAAAQGDWATSLAELAGRPDVVAVGETGLDYHYDFSDRASQHRVFERQLEISDSIGKPVIIHAREAHEDTLDALARHPGLNGVVFHCFTGNMAQAREILERGYWLSLTGVVTFKKSDELREVSRLIPDDRLMLETDSPYLTPEPVRNKRPNEPAHLIHTARCIAAERGMSAEALADLATANTRRFFGLPVP